MKPEELAERILHAAGSGLRHYMPSSKERILDEANKIISSITHPEDPQKPVERAEPPRLCLPQELTNERVVAIARVAGLKSNEREMIAFSRLLLSEVYK